MCQRAFNLLTGHTRDIVSGKNLQIIIVLIQLGSFKIKGKIKDRENRAAMDLTVDDIISYIKCSRI